MSERIVATAQQVLPYTSVSGEVIPASSETLHVENVEPVVYQLPKRRSAALTEFDDTKIEE